MKRLNTCLFRKTTLTFLAVGALILPAMGMPMDPRDSRHSIVEYSAGNDSLSIRTVNVPLKVILHELEQQCGLEITLLGAADDLINADIHKASLAAGVRLLLRGYNHSIVYAPRGTGGKEEITRIFLYPGKAGGPDATITNEPVAEHTSGDLPDGPPQLHGGPGEMPLYTGTPAESDPMLSMNGHDPLVRYTGETPFLPSPAASE